MLSDFFDPYLAHLARPLSVRKSVRCSRPDQYLQVRTCRSDFGPARERSLIYCDPVTWPKYGRASATTQNDRRCNTGGSAACFARGQRLAARRNHFSGATKPARNQDLLDWLGSNNGVDHAGNHHQPFLPPVLQDSAQRHSQAAAYLGLSMGGAPWATRQPRTPPPIKSGAGPGSSRLPSRISRQNGQHCWPLLLDPDAEAGHHRCRVDAGPGAGKAEFGTRRAREC
jgi:hypothetical protein